MKRLPQEVRLWKVDGDSLAEVAKSSPDFEKRLENWLEQNISMISDNLLVIGRQVVTAFGKSIDLLCLNRDGDLVIVELKRDKAPREVIAQVLEYASWVNDLSYEDVVNIADEYLKTKGTNLEEAFQQKFGSPLPDVLNESHEMLIVASDLDDQSERVIKYLNERGIRINAATFSYFKDGDREYIARVLLVPRSERREKGTKRRTYLSEEELRSIAEDNGVLELYITLVNGLIPLFDSRGTTLSSLAFVGVQEGHWNTIFNIKPKESNKENGLRFQVYLKRFAKYFGITEEEAKEILPENKEWKEARNPEYSGFEGFFKNKDEITTFISKLRELKEKQKQT